jgi:hypothetical protein
VDLPRQWRGELWSLHPWRSVHFVVCLPVGKRGRGASRSFVSPVVKASRWRFWGRRVYVISKGKKRSRLQLPAFSSRSFFMRPIAGLSDVIWDGRGVSAWRTR